MSYQKTMIYNDVSQTPWSVCTKEFKTGPKITPSLSGIYLYKKWAFDNIFLFLKYCTNFKDSSVNANKLF